jgi:GntR family transcriptional regulator
MFDRIDPRSPVPLYAQIADRVRLAIATGELPAGAALESVRALAGRLRINPATVVQAYRELDAEGYVEMRQGSGTYVRPLSAERRTREQGRQLRELIRRLLTEAYALGHTRDDVLAAVHKELEGK